MMWPMIGGNNNWKLLDCKPKKTNNKEEEQGTFTEVLIGIAAENTSSNKIRYYGSLENTVEEYAYYFMQ